LSKILTNKLILAQTPNNQQIIDWHVLLIVAYKLNIEMPNSPKGVLGIFVITPSFHSVVSSSTFGGFGSGAIIRLHSRLMSSKALLSRFELFSSLPLKQKSPLVGGFFYFSDWYRTATISL
jgi:hypothetical protein